MRANNVILAAIVVFSFVLSIYFYPQMPEQMVAHWGIKGDADGMMSRFWGLFLFPVLLTAFIIMFSFMPRIDPLRQNIDEFRGYFDNFIILLFAFFVALQALMISWNLGFIVPIIPFICVWIGALFYYAGVLMQHAKKNWFIGLRTPWTMSSEKVWDKTHKLGSKLFKVSGMIAILGSFAEEFAFLFVLGPIFVSAFYTTYYSYKEYQKEQKGLQQTAS